MVENTNTSNVRDTRFFHQPVALVTSLLSVEKSPTRGLRSHNSAAAVTMPAPMVGLREVSGAAMNAVTTVNGWASANAAPTADSAPLMITHSITICWPRPALRENPIAKPMKTRATTTHGIHFTQRAPGEDTAKGDWMACRAFPPLAEVHDFVQAVILEREATFVDDDAGVDVAVLRGGHDFVEGQDNEIGETG